MLILFNFYAVAFSCAAQKKYAYKERTIEEKARYFTKQMVASLTVSEEQEEALYEMNILVSAKFDSLNVFVDSLERQERSAAYRSIYSYRDSCMRKILPTKEFLKFQDIEREKYEKKKKIQQSSAIKKED